MMAHMAVGVMAQEMQISPENDEKGKIGEDRELREEIFVTASGNLIATLLIVHRKTQGKIGTYYAAVIENREDLVGRLWMLVLVAVVKGKIEEVDLPEKADILISEPMATLISDSYT
ncbi:hypothetical protein RHGRI_003293 [Rhododendron griersonianum]|uniref:Uncharacterized protein n=1 Tax=Rhododendron griersonianum TaxID=479676 RepID=A0AAV6L6R5_9ERIC|nr:hypothetical protein RHGRI_003293 [Rhododendron griersonianum]